jgi:hypothetical protein
MRQTFLIKTMHFLKNFQKAKKCVTTTSLSSNNNNLVTISKNLDSNLCSIKHIFAQCSDIIIREFRIGTDQQIQAFLVMIDGLTDKAVINDNLIKSLLLSRCRITKHNALTIVDQCVLSLASISKSNRLDNVVEAILSGDTVLFIDGSEPLSLLTFAPGHLEAWKNQIRNQ